MAYSWSTVAPLIRKYESGDVNATNSGIPNVNSSASGYYQITNSTWHLWAPKAGVDTKLYPTAYSAPRDVQDTVAEYGYNSEGLRPWAPYNPSLNAATGNQYAPSYASGSGYNFPNAVAAAAGITPVSGTDTLTTEDTSPGSFYIPGLDQTAADSFSFANPLPADTTADSTSSTTDPPTQFYVPGTDTTVPYDSAWLADSFRPPNRVDPETGALTEAGKAAASETSTFWKDLFTGIDNLLARFGFIILGILIIVVGLWAVVRGELGPTIQSAVKTR